eukprot:15471247-Heterocapsa_arctica.AAC.1
MKDDEMQNRVAPEALHPQTPQTAADADRVRQRLHSDIETPEARAYCLPLKFDADVERETPEKLQGENIVVEKT